MSLLEEISSRKLILLRALVVAVVLAASLVAPVALSVDDVSALGGAEEGEVEFAARFGAERPLALPGLVQPGWLVSSAGVAEAVVSVGSGGGEPVVGGVSVDWDVVGSSSSEPASASSSISSSQSGSSSGGSGGFECPSGFVLSGGGSSCVRVESVVSFLVCPSGFERFSVGLGSSGWGCRRVLGEGVASFSCVEGVLRVSGGSRVCVWVVEVVEVEAAVGSCSPGGVPPSCRYVGAGGVSQFGRLVFGCRSGWVLSEGSCSRVTGLERSAPPVVSYSCSSGVLVGSSCFEYAEPVRVCSPGWVLRSSGLCERAFRAAQQSTSPAAASVPVVWDPPGVPVRVSVSLGVRSGALSWGPPASDGGSPVVGYVLRWREGTSGEWTVVRLGASARRYEFTGLVGGGYYQIKLSARNRAPGGGGGFQEGRRVVRSLQPCSAGERVVASVSYVYCAPPPPPLPPAPGVLSLTPGKGSLTAVWGAPAPSAGDAAVAGFVVQWRRERGELDVGSGWNSVELEGAGVSSHVISGLLGGVSYQVMVKSYSASGKRSPAVLRDGVPLLAEECRTEAEPGFWRQVLDPVTGVCVGAPERFELEVGDGEGELQLRGGWSVGFSPEPVSDYVVRWRRSGSSDSWSETVADQGGGVLYKDSKIPYLDYETIGSYDPSYGLGSVSVEGVHTIGGLVDHVLYDVEVEARNEAGSSPVARGSGSPCPDPMSYVADVCAEAPVPEGVEVVSGDRSLTVSWRQDASIFRTDYDVFLYSTIFTKRYVLARELLSWRGGAVEVVNGKKFRTWSYTFTHENVPSAVAPSAVRLTNGRAYQVGVLGSNTWFNGETVFVVARPCADCDEVSRPPVSASPLVCSEGGVPVAGFCVSPCPQGRLRLGNSLNCSTPAPPTPRIYMSSVLSFETFPGTRHGTIDLSWGKGSFISRGLPITGYVVRWRRLGGAFAGWSSAPSSTIHLQAERGGFRIRRLAVGARYQVGVAAVNAAGTSRFAYETVKAACGRGYTHVEGTGFCILPPHPPQALTASPSGAGAVKVAWEQADWDNYHPVTGYQLRWRPAGSTTPWKTEEIPWADGKPAATAAGDPRREFTHTITGLAGAAATAGARLEIQVAADNEIPDNQSAWVSTTAVTCPTGQARLSAAAGCTTIPALPTDATAEAPTLTLHPTTGGITAAWWQRTAAFNPDTYKLEWKKTGAAASTPSAELTSAAVNIPLPSSYTGWTLNARHIPNLDMCTHDVSVTAAKSAQERVSNTASDAPGGTVTAPGAPREGLILSRSAGGDQLYVYWKRPECDGGAPLSEYKVTYKLDSDSTWTDAATMTSAAELARTHNGYRIGGLTQGTEYDVRVTAKNNRNLTRVISGSGEPVRVDDPKVDQDFEDDVWRPYRMPPDELAAMSERIQLGLTIRVCTSAADFVEPLNRVVAAWNAALADNQLNNPGESPTPRSGDAPAGEFEFSGTASVPADCGEEGGSGEMLSDNQGFEAVFMDYRLVCPVSTASGTACCPTAAAGGGCCTLDEIVKDPGKKASCCPITDEQGVACCPITNASPNDCDDTSCASTRHSTTDATARSIETAANCAANVSPCRGESITAGGCVNNHFHGSLLPRKTGGVQVTAQVTHMIQRLTDRAFAHELGHYLRLADYGGGCHWISEDTTESSLMSYGSNQDWRDYQRIVNTQDPEATNCRSDTITKRDKEDLHAIYHPPAFGRLSIGAGRRGKEHFVVGSPPQDLDGNNYYNAYRYVILHRAPKGTNINPNAFTQLMNGTKPVVFTPEQVEDAVDNNNSMLTSIDLKASSIAALMKKGHEFVFVGVTRGDPQRDPGKSLNPVSAAGLAHAVMTLNLGPNSGLVGDHKWTLGTPVTYIHQ